MLKYVYILIMLGAIMIDCLPVWAADQATGTAERLQELQEIEAEIADNAKRLQQDIQEEIADQTDQVADNAEKLRQDIEKEVADQKDQITESIERLRQEIEEASDKDSP